MVIVSRKAYKGLGKFDWYWEVFPGETKLIDKSIKVDLAYDRSGGLQFPLANDPLRVVDNLDFKKLA